MSLGSGVFTNGTDGAGGGGGGTSSLLSADMTSNPQNMTYWAEYNALEAEKEVLRQTDRHIEEQHRLTSSADQRAVAFAAVQMVVLGILFGNGVAPSIKESMVLVVMLMLLSVGLAIYSAKPTRIFGSGSDAIALKDYRKDNCQGYLLSTIILRNDRNITHNDLAIKNSALVFRGSLVAALFSVLLLFGDWLDIMELACRAWEK